VKANPPRPEPPPVLDPIKANHNFPLEILRIHQRINGVTTVALWDRTTGQVHRVGQFETIGPYIVTKIDVLETTVTLADMKANMRLGSPSQSSR
jgi:hypothetical protein